MARRGGKSGSPSKPSNWQRSRSMPDDQSARPFRRLADFLHVELTKICLSRPKCGRQGQAECQVDLSQRPNSLSPRKLLYAVIHFYKLLIEKEWFQILDARSYVRAERPGENLFIHVYILVMAPRNRQLRSSAA